MQAPFLPIFRSRLRVVTQKLATEVLVSGAATLLVMAMFSSVMRTPPPSAAAVSATHASASSEKTADFIAQVALSHVAGLKPAAGAAGADGAAAAPAPAVTPLAAVRTAAAHSHDRSTAVHVAAAAPDVLPPPRPSFSAPEPAVVAAIVPAVAAVPAKQKPTRPIEYGLRPLRYGMYVVTSVVDFVPATGSRVVEGVASVGGALSSFVKKL